MAVVYVGMVGAWLGEMVRLHEHVLPVHFLCLVCIAVKMLESILVAVYYHRQVRERGRLCAPNDQYQQPPNDQPQ